MKRIFISLIALFISLPAAAEEPCPSELGQDAKDAPIAGSLENCKTDLTKGTAPVKFEFPDDKKADKASDAGKAAEPDAPKAADPSEDPAAPAAAPAAENVPDAKPEVKSGRVLPETCTYSAYAWDTKKNRSTDHFKVSKAYSEVTDDERDPNVPECTICIEDQVQIDSKDLGLNAGKIRICHLYADQVRDALKEIADSGSFDLEKLEGYRPGKTRGPVDANGLRTVWSQHSYGTAIDINAHRNAIYSHCPGKIKNSADDVKTCKRGIGGDYNPKKYPRLTIVKDGTVYKIMTRFWKWGGEIDGQTKDTMHFSVTGY